MKYMVSILVAFIFSCAITAQAPSLTAKLGTVNKVTCLWQEKKTSVRHDVPIACEKGAEKCSVKDCKCSCHKKSAHKGRKHGSRRGSSRRGNWGGTKKHTGASKRGHQRKGRMAHRKKEAARKASGRTSHRKKEATKKETKRFSWDRWQTLRGGKDSERSARIKKFLEGMKKKASSAAQKS